MIERLRTWRLLLRDQRGVTAMEYALIAALIGAVIIGGVMVLGSSTSTLYQRVGSAAAGA